MIWERVNKMGKYRIGIDLGGTNIAAGITDDNGTILYKKSVPTNSINGIEYVVNSMSGLVLDIMKDKNITFDDVKSIGIGSPGSIDKKNGVVLYSNNIKFDNTPIRKMMTEYFGREINIFMDNDANCAALAEAGAGAAKGIDDVIMITLGTGIGGGIIIGGKPYGGFNNCGAELGHTVIEKNGVLCTCGRKGCWEAYSSATALIRMTREMAEEDENSAMWESYKENGAWNGRIAFSSARNGDKTAQKVVDKYISYLATGVTNLINIFQPEVFVIGGGVSNEGDNLLNPLREIVSKRIYTKSINARQTKIVKAITGNDAGIIGAALLNE